MRKILIFIPNYYPGYLLGGIARSVINSVDWLGDNFNLFIITRDRDLGALEPFENIPRNEWISVGKANVCYLSPDQLTFANLKKIIKCTDFDLIHLNSFFDPVFTIKLLLLRRFRFIKTKCVVLSPRGEFGWGSLSLKYIKKFTYIRLSKFFGFYKGVTWHASSGFEAQDVLAVMNPDPKKIFLAMDLPVNILNINLSPCSREEDANLKIVYLARLTREKNLDGAIQLLKKVNSKIDFHIYGPKEDPIYWSECEDLLTQLPAHINVLYCGVINPDLVFDTLANYDLLLLPSHGENYGHVIAESLSVGTRVLISTLTPWKNLEEDGLGWEIDLSNLNKYSEIIDKVAQQTLHEREKIRAKVRKTALIRLLNSKSFDDNHNLYLIN